MGNLFTKVDLKDTSCEDIIEKFKKKCYEEYTVQEESLR